MSRESHSSDLRDSSQRSLGYVGLSALIHVGILIAVALAPSFKSQVGEISGAQAGEPIEFSGNEIADPAAPMSLGDSSEPTEVLLADASDATAVAVAAEIAPQEAAAPVEAKAVEAKPAPAKLRTAKAVTAPAVAKDTVASENGDVEIQAALAKARAEKKEEVIEKPEEAPVEKIAEQTGEETSSEEIAPEISDFPAQAETEVEAAATETKEVEAAAKAELAPVKIAAQEEAPTQAATAAPQAQAAPAGSADGTVSGSSQNPGAFVLPKGTGAGTAGRSSGAAADSGTFGVAPGSPIRDVTQLIAMPGNTKPTYPMQDKLLGKQGTTVLIGEVRNDGTISQVALERSSGSKLMDESALKAFKSWRFKPGQAGLVRNLFQFQLVGEAKETPARLRRQ